MKYNVIVGCPHCKKSGQQSIELPTMFYSFAGVLSRNLTCPQCNKMFWMNIETRIEKEKHEIVIEGEKGAD
jgi:uncharacterized protein YbaR (Trm112 family)